jgi:hypothetical protein
MDIDDKELFSSAMTDAPALDVAEQPAEAPAAEAPQQDGQARDEHGRFAARQAETTVDTPPHQAPVPEKEEANVPSWRLREVREEAERRVAETEARWQRQFEMLQRQNAPKPEPTPAPDLFENPNGFVDHQLRQSLSPLEQQQQALRAELQETREFYSRRDAEKEHGPEAVRSAYDWLAKGTQARDPDVLHVYQQVMQSKHPFDAIVTAHKRVNVMQQIGNDPDAWAINRARELAAADPKHREALYAQTQTNGRQSTSPQGSIVKLPPSLKNVASSQIEDDDNDASDAALFRHAMR